jgi:thiol-disulfide isomerase/thioredoxin
MSSLRLPWPGAALLAAILLSGAAAPPPYPPRTLVLFVASWCAPCHGELRQLESIAALAAPITVRVTPVDQSYATAAMLRDVPAARIWRSARAVDAYAQQSGSLPFSVMTDGSGRPCATHDRALDAASIVAMRRRCGTVS